MCELTVTIPDEQASVLNVPRERAADELRMLAAVKLYELDPPWAYCLVTSNKQTS